MRFVRFVALLTIALSFVSCSRDPKKVRQQALESGNRYYDKGKFKEASIMYRNSIKADPRFGPAYYKLGLVELKQQRIASAVAPLRRAMELLPSDSPEWIDANVKYAEIMLLAAQAPEVADKNQKVLDEVRGIKDMLLKRNPSSFEGMKLEGELTLNDAMVLYRKGKTAEFKETMERAIQVYRKALTQKPNDPTTMLALGKTLMLYGEMDEAEQMYRQVIDQDKTLLAPYNELYKVYIAKRKLPEAENILKRAIAAHPNDYNLQTLLAAHYFSVNNRPEMTKVVTAKPDNFVARFNLGRAYFAKGDLEQARQQFDAALKQRQDYMPARLALTQLALRRGDVDAALKLAQDTRKMNPASGTATLLEAAAYLRKGQTDEARALLEAILKQNPNQVDTLLELGVLNMVQKKYKDAEDAFRKASAVDPSNVRGVLGMVEVHLAQGQQDEAVKVMKDEVAKQPQRTEVKKELATTLLRAKRIDEGIAVFQSILEPYKDSPTEQADIYFRIGQAYQIKKELPKALEAVKKARTLVPTNVTYINLLAQLQDAAGKKDEALTAYRDAMKIDPTNAVVLNNLAYLMTEMGGNLDEALTLAQRAKQQLPTSNEVSDTIGWIYIKKKLNDNAIEIFRDLNAKVKDNSVYHMHYAMALAQKGDKANAIREYKAALQFSPTKDNEDAINELIRKLS
jgi:tetratricopeptide (TPR) repeat protein